MAPDRASAPMMTVRVLEEVFRRERVRVLGALVAACGDLSLAEDALQDACAQALRAWPDAGIPRNPAAWLTTVARRRIIDLVRRDQRFEPLADEASVAGAESAPDPDAAGDSGVPDHRLQLIFTCCHPSIAPASQVALALRVLCGLSTREIARAFVEPEATTAQRLVRAKRKILEARIPFRIPPRELLPERVSGVLATIYLMFNEGYAATEDADWLRPALTQEAIRFARLVVETLPDEPEAAGLLALLLLHDSRREARICAGGSFVPLDEQDRSLWTRKFIDEGVALLRRTLGQRRPGPYQLQAAISALHAQAPTAAETDWLQISALYRKLLEAWPTPIVELNAAVAHALGVSLEAGLAWIDGIERRGELAAYHFLPAAKADLLRRADRPAEARAAYDAALLLVRHPTEREYLERRRGECD